MMDRAILNKNKPTGTRRPRRLCRRRGWIWTVMLAALWGCAAVGPDYKAPEVSAPAQWRNAGAGPYEAAPPQSPSLAFWWRQLEDPVLTALIQRAEADNRDVRQARARVREARARLGITRSETLPSVDGSGSVTRSGSGGNTGKGESDSYVAGFDAGWELDVFGGARRSVEASRADLDASVQDLRDVGVTLTAEVARNYVQVRILQARMAVAEDNLAVQEETFQLARWRFEAGLSDELAYRQALYNLESTRARLPSLRIDLEAAMNRIAVLLGQPPGAVHADLSPVRDIPCVPAAIAVGVPADTVRQRPDVARAERRLAAQTAKIGVAVAELYPKFTISGSIGWGAANSGDLFTAGSQSYNIGPRVSWRLFDRGAVRRAVTAQTAVQEQYLAAYEGTVLTALEEVENTLQALVQEQLRADRLRAAVASAREAFALARDKYKAGLSDFSDVLEAQRSVLTLQDSLVQSRGSVATDLIALYKAMGGGWQAVDSKPKETEHHEAVNSFK